MREKRFWLGVGKVGANATGRSDLCCTCVSICLSQWLFDVSRRIPTGLPIADDEETDGHGTMAIGMPLLYPRGRPPVSRTG